MPYIMKRTRTKHRDFVTRSKCYYYNVEASKRKRGVRLAPTPEGKKKRNARQRYQKRKFLIYNNFDKGDMWVTLTYKAEAVPETPEDGHKNLMNVLAKLHRKLKRKGTEFVYFVKTEAGEKTRVHHHLLIKNNFSVIDELYKLWKGFGNVRDFREIYDMASGALVTYILDGGKHKSIDFEKFSHSRNLKEPEVEVRIYPAESFRENPRPPKSDEDGFVWVIENLNNYFPDSDGFIYQEYELVRKEVRKE